MAAALLLASVGVAKAADWAVLVAGSNTWGNYRHQADICHSYQVVHKYGIPDERIIVFQYNDLANNAANPFKGQIFNKPTTGAGVDVYAGCLTDYTGKDVTPQNFLAALTGDSATTGGKKVLRSGPNDNVFIFFSDHGATGIIAFPTTTLSARDLNTALKTMKSKNMFSKLVFYLEACESGSMFEGLIDPSSGIYVTTASGADESSWGTYCPPDDKINGKELGTCLGDLYSVNWMENSDLVGPTETLQVQYEDVKKKTTLSKVMQYGDLSYVSEPIGNFIGDKTSKNRSVATADAPNPAGIVNSRDIPMHLAYYAYLRASQSDFKTRLHLAEELQQILTKRVEADLRFMSLARFLGNEDLFHNKPRTAVGCGECCETVHTAHNQFCGAYDDYSLQYARVVVNACNLFGASIEGTHKIVNALKTLCSA